MQWNSFSDVYLVSKFDVSNFSETGDIQSYFAEFEQFNVDIYFAYFGQVKLSLFGPFC